MAFAIDEVEKMLKNHMDNQPYEIVCACGKDLDVFKHSVDNDYELSLTVGPCPDCMAEAKAEGERGD